MLDYFLGTQYLRAISTNKSIASLLNPVDDISNRPLKLPLQTKSDSSCLLDFFFSIFIGWYDCNISSPDAIFIFLIFYPSDWWVVKHIYQSI